MTLINIKNKYDIAVDGQGYMLKGTPESPRYRCNQGTLFNQRFAQGDRSYEDLSQFWFTRQTDWFQGVKNDQSWEDDGKFYLASNIDTSDETGLFKLHLGHDSAAGTTITSAITQITSGTDGLVSADSGKYIGTDADTGTGKPYIYRQGTPNWTSVGPDSFPTKESHSSTDYISFLKIIRPLANDQEACLFFGTSNTLTDASFSRPVIYYATDPSATTWTTPSTIIQTKCALGAGERLVKCLTACNDEDNLYIFVCHHKCVDQTNKRWSLVSTATTQPSTTDAADYTLMTKGAGEAISSCMYGGNIYYLIYDVTNKETALWKYDITNTATVKITIFRNTNYNNNFGGSKYMFELNNKLIITVPDKEIWEYDGSNINRIFLLDKTKNDLGQEFTTNLYYGGLPVGNKGYWYNLIYDGINFHNWIKDPYDSETAVFFPLFVTTDNKWYGVTTYDKKTLYGLGTQSYKGTADKNFLIFNNIDTIAGIDKTAFHVDLIFNALNSGEKIVVYYTSNELTTTTTWTELGTVSNTSDGGTITQKRLLFPDNIDFRKIWFKINLEGSGSTTPKVRDIIFAYLPKPNPDAVWTMTINCGDYVETLQGERTAKTGRELKEKLWLLLRNQQTVTFQDVNYSSAILASNLGVTDTTITVDSTDEFPESGRLMIGDVVYYYTGKTQTTFTGVTQGEKDTQVVAKVAGDTVHNGYKVRIQSIDTIMPTGYENDVRKNEYDVQISLREIR